MPGWEVISSGGNGWQVECPPRGIPLPPAELNTKSCFVTSYSDCKRTQTIDLTEVMASHLSILDDLKLSIVMEVWVANRFDCGATYECELGTSDVSGGNYQVLHVKSLTLDTGEWMKIDCKIPYKSGQRYLHFEDSGRDKRFWAGWYGAKITGASIKLVLEK